MCWFHKGNPIRAIHSAAGQSAQTQRQGYKETGKTRPTVDVRQDDLLSIEVQTVVQLLVVKHLEEMNIAGEKLDIGGTSHLRVTQGFESLT